MSEEETPKPIYVSDAARFFINLDQRLSHLCAKKYYTTNLNQEFFVENVSECKKTLFELFKNVAPAVFKENRQAQPSSSEKDNEGASEE